ncbi:MAG: hypothetical protein HDQ99_17360 [Lachnospiraceae bacterium]|nr:hypothetical protein [Lachnospiraceae bacterium]
MDTRDENEIVDFLILAKRNTYAAVKNQTASSRKNSHDFCYEKDGFTYYDSYLGGKYFAGEEAVWRYDSPIWSMNYTGRVVGENFDGVFLKEALMAVPKELPFRGPEIYTKGDYQYRCRVDGSFEWFQGYEEIFYGSEKIYECYFHGGVVE